MDITFETTVMSADGTTATGTCTLGGYRQLVHRHRTGLHHQREPDPVRHRDRRHAARATTPPCSARVLQKKLDDLRGQRRDAGGLLLLAGRRVLRTVNLMVNEMVPVDGAGPALCLPWSWWRSSRACCPLHRPVHGAAGLHRRPAGSAAHRPAADHDLPDGLHRPDGHRRQQRHRLRGLRQSAASGRHGAPCGPRRHRQDPYAPHPDDHPDHAFWPCCRWCSATTWRASS